MRGILRAHRIDRDASRRRARAQAHLDRVRQRRGGERRSSGARRRPRRRLWIPLVAALLGVLFGESAWLALVDEAKSSLRVAVCGTERLSPAQVAEAAGLHADTRIEEVDLAALRASLEQHDWIAEAAILRLPGGALLVGVVERRPVATLTRDGQLYAVDERGAPFAAIDTPETGLIRLVSAADTTPGEPSTQLAEALRLANRLPALGMARPSLVSVAAEDDPEGYAFQLDALPTRVVLGRAELDARLDDLARLVATRPDAVAEATDIDLRFANQVVLRSAPAREGSANKAPGRGNAPARNQPPTG